tara:strand:+ start:347 stop:499 length:153 start_codon:yes stop_codon:yes gene_type:complete
MKLANSKSARMVTRRIILKIPAGAKSFVVAVDDSTGGAHYINTVVRKMAA